MKPEPLRAVDLKDYTKLSKKDVESVGVFSSWKVTQALQGLREDIEGDDDHYLQYVDKWFPFEKELEE